MSKSVTIHGHIWELVDIQSEITWCAQQSWELVTYSNPHDHEHCTICQWAIGVSTDPAKGSAYVTNGHHWLCRECHDKFTGPAA